jgi:hypothetical protein
MDVNCLKQNLHGNNLNLGFNVSLDEIYEDSDADNLNAEREKNFSNFVGFLRTMMQESRDKINLTSNSDVSFSNIHNVLDSFINLGPQKTKRTPNPSNHSESEKDFYPRNTFYLKYLEANNCKLPNQEIYNSLFFDFLDFIRLVYKHGQREDQISKSNNFNEKMRINFSFHLQNSLNDVYKGANLTEIISKLNPNIFILIDKIHLAYLHFDGLRNNDTTVSNSSKFIFY